MHVWLLLICTFYFIWASSFWGKNSPKSNGFCSIQGSLADPQPLHNCSSEDHYGHPIPSWKFPPLATVHYLGPHSLSRYLWEVPLSRYFLLLPLSLSVFSVIIYLQTAALQATTSSIPCCALLPHGPLLLNPIKVHYCCLPLLPQVCPSTSPDPQDWND